MKVIVEVGAASAMLGEACHARMALAILANASEVTPSRISEEDVGAKVDGLSKPLEAPTSARKASQIRRIIDCHKDIGIFRDRLVGYQRSYERDTQHPRTDACSSHKRADGEKKRPARFSNRRHGTMGSVAAHLA